MSNFFQVQIKMSTSLHARSSQITDLSVARKGHSDSSLAPITKETSIRKDCWNKAKQRSTELERDQHFQTQISHNFCEKIQQKWAFIYQPLALHSQSLG